MGFYLVNYEKLLAESGMMIPDCCKQIQASLADLKATFGIVDKGISPEVVVEAYSRPTRVVRGKDVDSDMKVDDVVFETNEEKALSETFLSVKNKVHLDI
ncbi:glycine--tRNA ligase 2, chloroplastic/mitochondrial-like protein, partial [Corchorus capsularis]